MLARVLCWGGGSEDVYRSSSASVIRTAHGWKDNRQNNVLFKDGSLLFIKP